MNPESLRAIKIEPGSPICVMGEDGPHPWLGGPYVDGILTKYLTLEHYLWSTYDQRPKPNWDVAAWVSLSAPLEIIAKDAWPLPARIVITTECYWIQEMLVIQRYPDLPWEDDEWMTVATFAILEKDFLARDNLWVSEWKDKTVQLTSHSIFNVGKCKRLDLPRYTAPEPA